MWNHKTSKTKQRKSSGSVRQSSEERRKSTEVEDIDEMLESPLRKLVKPAHEETITLSPRMGSPGFYLFLIYQLSDLGPNLLIWREVAELPTTVQLLLRLNQK